MKTIITNVQQFLDLTGCTRETSKKNVDLFISMHEIDNDDLIADIYASCGIDAEEEDLIQLTISKQELRDDEWIDLEVEIRNVSIDYMNQCIDKSTLKWFRGLGGKEIVRRQSNKITSISIMPSGKRRTIREFKI